MPIITPDPEATAREEGLVRDLCSAWGIDFDILMSADDVSAALLPLPDGNSLYDAQQQLAFMARYAINQRRTWAELSHRAVVAMASLRGELPHEVTVSVPDPKPWPPPKS